MSRYGKDARGRLEEGSRWNFDRMKNAFDRGDFQYGRGDYFSNYLADRFGEMSRGRFGTADEMHQMGQEIMPWMDPMLAQRAQRVQQMMSNYDGIGPVSETIDQHSRRFDEMGGNIGRNYDAIDTDITNLQNRSNQRAEYAHNDIVNNIQGEYGSLLKNNQGVYGSLIGDTKDTFNTAIKDVMPGSIARAATSARAFAPQMASTLLRLRRAGIDPNSSEAQSLLRQVEGQRSRAMDDKLGESIDKTNSLRLGRLDATTGLTQDAHNNEIGFTLGRMNDMNDQWRRNFDVTQGIDRDMTGMKMDNRDVHFQRGQDFQRDRAGNDLLYRGMREQDVFNRNNLLERQNEEDAFGHDMRFSRYNAGVDARGRDIDYQNQGLRGLEGIVNTSYGQGNFQDGSARAFGQQATQTDRDLWQHAAANGNWLGKFLMGAGTAALGAYTGMPAGGGFTDFAKGFGSRIIGGGQGAPGGGYAGGYRTPDFNPNAPYSSAQWDQNNVPRFRAGAPNGWTQPAGQAYGYNASMFKPSTPGGMQNQMYRPTTPPRYN
jgi:hypothetical protein